ncbi:hypothetical protein CVAR_1010 [Corynebacterium variabile DSM 44702]|uniref:Uncharacterized protein n=1 Tax=Corynebacterium variabile (strain DSM 44702 / CIP 107183 / JCM 12073 / NCIMB 30131) TaxID=858619 RepID=G0HDP6_CORVD|nr:hypothetical protein CVAR_1010 [Corynebacterium variabile DSM 44702]
MGLSVTLGGLGLWFYLVALLVMPRYRRPAVAGGGAAEERAGPALHP